MKKISGLFLIISAAVLLCSCGGDDGDTAEPRTGATMTGDGVVMDLDAEE